MHTPAMLGHGPQLSCEAASGERLTVPQRLMVGGTCATGAWPGRPCRQSLGGIRWLTARLTLSFESVDDQGLAAGQCVSLPG